MKRGHGWWEICITKSIGLAHIWKANKNNFVLAHLSCLFVCLFFVLFCLFLFAGNFQVKVLRAYIRRGNLTEGFSREELVGLIHRGAYFLSFTV